MHFSEPFQPQKKIVNEEQIFKNLFKQKTYQFSNDELIREAGITRVLKTNRKHDKHNAVVYTET